MFLGRGHDLGKLCLCGSPLSLMLGRGLLSVSLGRLCLCISLVGLILSLV